MPLDPAAQAFLQAMAAQGAPSYPEMGVEGARAGGDRFAMLQKPPREVAEVVDASYGEHPNQALRIYRPPGDLPLPVVVYFHGGGFVTGGLSMVDEPSRAIALDSGALVVAATYRLAPEDRFPAAHDDAYAALVWASEHIAEYGGDPARMAVMGDSAGGNLAASAAIRGRDAGGPPLAAQVLVYPMTDPVAQTPSREEFASGHMIEAADLAWFGSQYVTREADLADPRFAVARTASLAGLPPTLILTNECDMLRDEAEDFAARLALEGVDTQVVRFDGLIHIVLWMDAVIPRASELFAEIATFLRQRLG